MNTRHRDKSDLTKDESLKYKKFNAVQFMVFNFIFIIDLIMTCMTKSLCIIYSVFEFEKKRRISLHFNMQIYIKSLTRSILLNVEPSDKIEELKTQIEEKDGIPIQEQSLIFLHKKLENGNSIQDYDIRNNSTIYLFLPLKGSGMQIFVTTIIGNHITLTVEPNELIENIKEKIKQKLGYEISDQIIIFGGKKLENGNTLQDYSVQKNSTLHLVARLHGGS